MCNHPFYSLRFSFLQINLPRRFSFPFIVLHSSTELNDYNKKQPSEPSVRRRPASIYHLYLFPLETARERERERERERAGTEEAGRNLFRSIREAARENERGSLRKEVSATGFAVFWIRPNGVPIIQIFK